MAIDDVYHSEDLISVQSFDEELLRQEFKYANELVKGQTKAEPIEGDYEELDQQLVGANGKKGQAFEPDENFDEMMVDEGVRVSATNMR